MLLTKKSNKTKLLALLVAIQCNDIKAQVISENIDVTTKATDYGYAYDLLLDESFTLNSNASITVNNGEPENIGLIGLRGNNEVRILGDLTIVSTNKVDGIKDTRTIGNGYNIIYFDGSLTSTTTDSESPNAGNNAIVLTTNQNNLFLNGIVSTEGENSNGVYVSGNENDLLIAGEITSAGRNANGLNMIGSNNYALISGLIRTSDYEPSSSATAEANALRIAGDNNYANITGLLTTNASDSSALKIDGNYNEIIVDGVIKTTSADSIASVTISSSAKDNIIHLRPGARIIGEIVNESSLADNNTLILDVGSAQSYVFETTDVWTFQDLDGRPVTEGSTMAAGIGNAETADEFMFDRSIGLVNSLARLERQSSFDDRRGLFDAYGFSQSRNEDGTISAYVLNSRGMTIGLPLELLGDEAIAFVNYHDSNIDISSGTHDIDAQSLRFGLSIPEMWGDEHFNIGVYAVAGRNSYDGVRDVLINQNTTTGITSNAASWDSSEVELGLNASNSYRIKSNLTLDSSIGLASQIERIGPYSEQNYFEWSGRTIVQTHAKAEVTLGYQATETTRLYGKAGLWHRDVQSGKAANYTINNTTLSYNGGIYDDTIMSLRVGFEYRLGNGSLITADVATSDSNSADFGYGASLGVSLRF